MGEQAETDFHSSLERAPFLASFFFFCKISLNTCSKLLQERALQMITKFAHVRGYGIYYMFSTQYSDWKALSLYGQKNR